MILPDGTTVNRTYDQNGQLLKINRGTASLWSYNYDTSGRPIAVTGDAGTFEYSYDSLDRVTSYKDPFGDVTKIDYDAPGRFDTIHAPDGSIFQYRYNNHGLIESVATGKGKIGFLYDQTGRLIGIIYPNHMKALYEYVAGNRLKSVTYKGSDANDVYHEAYEYDSRGNIISVKDDQGDNRFTYDALDRLTMVTYPNDGSERFSYDAAGNIVGTQDMARWVYDEDQQLTAWGNRRLQYDLAGNLKQIEDINAFLARYSRKGL